MTVRRRGLAERRKALGFSQESLAEKLGADRSTVARWERGECQPQPFIRPKLGSLLRVTPDELAILLMLEVAEEPTRQVSPTMQVIPNCAVPEPVLDRGEPDDMNRRELLRLLSIAGTLVAAPGQAEAAEVGWADQTEDAGDIEQYELLNPHLWRVFALSSSKGLVYPVVRQQLNLLMGAMQRSLSPDMHKRLCILASDLFQMAGEILFDRDRYTDAAYCYIAAANSAKEVRAFDLWACALTRHAFISMYDKQFAQAASILAVAARVAQQGDTQLSTRHWVAVVQAQAFAGLGNADACKDGLDAAEQVLALNGQVHSGGWLRFDGSRLAEERGSCYLALGRFNDAQTVLVEALGQTVSLRRRGSVLTDLAMLGIQRRDLDQLLQYGGDAVDLAEQTQSAGYIGRKLHAVQSRLAPLFADSRVSQLNDRIARLSAVA